MIAQRSVARLLAVQAVYQMIKEAPKNADSLIKEFLDHRTGIDSEGDEIVSPDKGHFIALIRGVTDHAKQLGDIIIANRGKDGDIEPILKAILLCGTFELMMLQDIDAPIIISDYVHVTEAFYEGKETKLVNAVLDSISKSAR